MKKKYIFLLIIFALEIEIISILSKKNIQITSFIGKAIGTLVFILPILILLFLLSKDKDISDNKRLISKVILWFIIICYIIGGIASLTQI